MRVLVLLMLMLRMLLMLLVLVLVLLLLSCIPFCSSQALTAELRWGSVASLWDWRYMAAAWPAWPAWAAAQAREA